MMIKILFSFSILTLVSCNYVNDFYQGKVIDEQNKPLENVIVSEDDSKKGIKTKTDANGYFKLTRNHGWLGNLIFFKAGYKMDTIPTVMRQSGEQINYNFIKKRDTTTIIMKQIK